MLLQFKVDPLDSGNTVVMVNCRQGQIIVRDVGGGTPLHHAAQGDTDRVSVLQHNKLSTYKMSCVPIK